MERAKGEEIPMPAPPARDPVDGGYEPPQVAWEEEFEPMAAVSCDPNNPQFPNC